MPDIQKTNSTKCSIIQITHRYFRLKCLLSSNTLFAYYCCFCCIYISQGSVAM